MKGARKALPVQLQGVAPLTPPEILDEGIFLPTNLSELWLKNLIEELVNLIYHT